MTPRRSRRVRGALLYGAVWTPVFVFYAVGMFQFYKRGCILACRDAAVHILPGILVNAIAWWLMERVPWRSLRPVKFATTQFAVVFASGAIWQATFLGFLWFLTSWKMILSVVRRWSVLGLLMDLLICGLQAAVFHAIRMSREMQEKELAAVESDRLRIRAEMEAMRGQLNPHFLFNSLHSITALVRDDPKQAEEALLQFAALLRRVLDVKRDSTDEVALADEMAFIDDYLAIERLRLGDRLRVDRQISPDALKCWLPVFSVQPLVENALRHAIAPRRDGGRLSVRAAVSGGQLQVEVEDDGPGADTSAVGRSSGVGLNVIRRRLNLRHGARAALNVLTSPGSGFKVRLSLPVEAGPLVESAR